MPSYAVMHPASAVAVHMPQSQASAGALAGSAPAAISSPSAAQSQLKVLQQWEKRLLAVLNANSPNGPLQSPQQQQQQQQQQQGGANGQDAKPQSPVEHSETTPIEQAQPTMADGVATPPPQPTSATAQSQSLSLSQSQSQSQKSGSEWIVCPLGVRCSNDASCQSSAIHHRYFRLDKRDIRRIHWSESATEESNFRGLKRRLEARGFKRNKDKEEPSRRHISVWFDAEGILSGGSAVAADSPDLYVSPPRTLKSAGRGLDGRIEKAKNKGHVGRPQSAALHGYPYDAIYSGANNYVHPGMIGPDGPRMMHAARGPSAGGVYAPQFYGQGSPYNYASNGYAAAAPYTMAYRPHPHAAAYGARDSYGSPIQNGGVFGYGSPAAGAGHPYYAQQAAMAAGPRHVMSPAHAQAYYQQMQQMQQPQTVVVQQQQQQLMQQQQQQQLQQQQQQMHATVQALHQPMDVDDMKLQQQHPYSPPVLVKTEVDAVAVSMGAPSSQDIPILRIAKDGAEVTVSADDIDAHISTLRGLVAGIKQRFTESGPAGLLPSDGQLIDSVANAIANRCRRRVVSGLPSHPAQMQVAPEERHKVLVAVRRTVDACVAAAVNRAAKPGGLDMIASLASVRLHAESPQNGRSPSPSEVVEVGEGLGLIESKLSSALCVE